MLRRTRWRLVEEPCTPQQARSRWEAARQRGATGAVTSWGSGIRGRDALRCYWEAREGAELPQGEDLAEEDWTPYWRQSLTAVRVTDRIVLVPAWQKPPAGALHVLRVDPGMAFGAGDHPTTRLCLRFLEELAGAGALPPRVLDVGAGTGVLALACARLGATRVDALDIDPFGYVACRRNAALNDLSERVRPLLLSLDLLDARYPLVLANIVASQLEALAALLRERVAPGGKLLLSGFERENERRVRGALGWPVAERREEEGWVAVVLRADLESN